MLRISIVANMLTEIDKRDKKKKIQLNDFPFLVLLKNTTDNIIYYLAISIYFDSILYLL